MAFHQAMRAWFLDPRNDQLQPQWAVWLTDGSRAKAWIVARLVARAFSAACDGLCHFMFVRRDSSLPLPEGFDPLWFTLLTGAEGRQIPLQPWARVFSPVSQQPVADVSMLFCPSAAGVPADQPPPGFTVVRRFSVRFSELLKVLNTPSAAGRQQEAGEALARDIGLDESCWQWLFGGINASRCPVHPSLRGFPIPVNTLPYSNSVECSAMGALQPRGTAGAAAAAEKRLYGHAGAMPCHAQGKVQRKEHGSLQQYGSSMAAVQGQQTTQQQQQQGRRAWAHANNEVHAMPCLHVEQLTPCLHVEQLSSMLNS